MNFPTSWLSADQTVLFASKIQLVIALLAGLAWIVDYLLGRTRAAWRSFLWGTVLLGVLLSPGFCWIGPSLPWRLVAVFESEPGSKVGAKTDQFKEKIGNAKIGTLASAVGVPDPEFRALADGKNAQPVFSQTGLSPTNEALEGSLLGIGFSLVGLIFTVWFLGSMVLALRLIYGLGRIRWAFQDLQSIDENRFAGELSEVSSRIGGQTIPDIFISNAVRGPLVFGLIRPKVILPDSIMGQLSREQLCDILVHECAHIQRRDLWVKLFQQIATILFWVNPFLYLLNRKLDLAREEVCDNFVLGKTEPPVYAATLLWIGEKCFPVPAKPGLLNMVPREHELERRVIDLLNPGRNTATGIPGYQKWAIFLILFVLLGFSGTLGIQARSETGGSDPLIIAQKDEKGAEKETISGNGLNSNAGFSGAIVLNESNFVLNPANPNPPPQPLQKQEEPLAFKVQRSIDKAVEFIRSQEKEKGNWEVDGEAAARKGGWTSLAMLAQLNAGVNVDDAIIQRGLAYLRKLPPEQTYTVGLQTMVFAQAGLPQDKPLIQRNVDWLVKSRIPAREGRTGGWGYGSGQGSPDNSNSQYALMGLHDAIQAGAVVEEKILNDIQKDLVESQQVDWGWSYRNEPFTTLTMTNGCLSSLIIISADLRQRKHHIKDDGVEEKCGYYQEYKILMNGFKWIDDNFPSQIQTTADAYRWLKHPFYCFHGIERVARSTGHRFFGGADWYRVGSEFLLTTQGKDGSWGKETGSFGSLDSWPVVATSFSLLFLTKGRTPVIIAKFAHHAEENWNRKHNDLRHLVPFVSAKAFGGVPLAWQVFDTKKLKLKEKKDISDCCQQLLEIPVVWLSGHGGVPEKAQREVLKEYLDKGGFLFAEACCGSADFDKDFRAMMKDLYPGQSLEPLPKDHPIWGASGQLLSKQEEFPLFGIVKDKKTIVVYSPRPISGYWEANLQSNSRGLGAFYLGANVIAYATDKKAPPPR